MDQIGVKMVEIVSSHLGNLELQTEARPFLNELRAELGCPYCGQAYGVVKQILKELGNKLAFVFRNYPLQQLHLYALHAAIAAEAANLQRKFWEMHDIIFENQRHLDDASLLKYAKEIDLNITQFEKDFSSKATIEKVEEDINSGNKAKVQGTPSFFVNGKFFDGDWGDSEFLEYLESFL